MTPSTPLKGLPLAVLDVETTGIDPETDHVVEVAVVHTTLSPDATPRVVLSRRVRPPIPIPEAASRVHGITDEDVEGCPTWEEVLPGVLAACADRAVVAYNAPFDMGFIPELPGPWLCAAIPARVIKPWEWAQEQVCEARGIDLEPHGAAGDTVATALLYPDLLDEASRGKVWGHDLAMLHRWQRREALAAEASFCRWARGKAKARRPDCPWHDIYAEEAPPWPPRPRPSSVCDCGVLVTVRITRDGTLGVLDPDDNPHTCRGAA